MVIETPKGSRNKLDYDPRLGAFRLAKTLPEGMVFPYDFGFVPLTRGEDGDPLDALVLMAESTVPGCVVDCRLIGMIEATQKERGKKPVGNDRYIAISSEAACEFSDIERPDDLPAQMLDQLEKFFVNYNDLEGKVFRCLGTHGPKRALKTLKSALRKA
ncbi:MAG: hypothetical protein JWM88_1916 [Verrucomicrobia bacterium]|nr:hypothetical protein [Verrucomicrobiota bacterium]